MNNAKFLIILLLSSICGNIYQATQITRKPNPQFETTPLVKEAAHEKLQKDTRSETVSNSLQGKGQKETRIQKEKATRELSYDQIKDKAQSDLEMLTISELNHSSEEVAQIFRIIKESQLAFDTYIQKKIKISKKKYGFNNYGYSYDPYDYIALGKTRLETRDKLKELLGKNAFRSFMKFIKDYNHGHYTESFVPIEI